MYSGPWIWDNYTSVFAPRGYECSAPALRFHDVDPKAPPDPALGTTSVLDYVSDVEAAVAGLDEAPILVGHSMGGIVAQIVASRTPLRALVLLTPTAPNGITTSDRDALKVYFGPLKRWGFWRKPMRPTFEQATFGLLCRCPPDEQRRLYERMVWESGRAAFELGFHALDSKKATRVDCSKVTCPVLAVGASEDRAVPTALVRKVAACYPRATYEEFAGHAHWLCVEPGWEETAGHIAGWLKEVGAKP